MTFKYNPNSSRTLKQFAKIAEEKGWLPPKESLEKKASTQSLEATGNLTNDITTLCNALREKGYISLASNLEDHLFAFKVSLAQEKPTSFPETPPTTSQQAEDGFRKASALYVRAKSTMNKALSYVNTPTVTILELSEIFNTYSPQATKNNIAMALKNVLNAKTKINSGLLKQNQSVLSVVNPLIDSAISDLKSANAIISTAVAQRADATSSSSPYAKKMFSIKKVIDSLMTWRNELQQNLKNNEFEELSKHQTALLVGGITTKLTIMNNMYVEFMNMKEILDADSSARMDTSHFERMANEFKKELDSVISLAIKYHGYNKHFKKNSSAFYY